jgi:hypothetical protein
VTNVVRYATTTKQTNARYAVASGEDGCKDARKSLAAVSVWDARYNGAVLSVLALWAGL